MVTESDNMLIGGFRILKRLHGGYGSQGFVRSAVCEKNIHGIVAKGTRVALKIMRVEDDDDGLQWDRLVKRTAELVALDNKNVVRYLGCFKERDDDGGELHVVVQELLSGETLKAKLARHSTGIDADEALFIAREAVKGLSYVAGKGIVHRDIKPSNIFLCLDDKRRVTGVKLIDFEISRQRDGTRTTGTGGFHGTFNYMAPDFQTKGFRGDERSDVYSMGVVIHEMLTGRLPYAKEWLNPEYASVSFMQRGKDALDISRRVNRILVRMDGVLEKSLAFESEGRYQSFAELQTGLKEVNFRELESPESHNVYRILQYIGKGGFGEVLKGRDLKTERTVAIKRLLNYSHADRFRREGRVVARLRDNSFVRFFEYFEAEAKGRSTAYLVMDFLRGMPGNSLKDAISRREWEKNRDANMKDVITAFIRYARALKALHEAGIIHRDVKPANLYYPKGHPRHSAIMDMGVARDVNGTLTEGSAVPGTWDYQPPEVVVLEQPNNDELKPRPKSRGDAGMDIFALGLSLYEAITGKSAYEKLAHVSDDRQKQYLALVERSKSYARPRFDDESVKSFPELLNLLKDMTEPHLSKRIQDAEVVVERLRAIARKLAIKTDSEDCDYDTVPIDAPYGFVADNEVRTPWHKVVFVASIAVLFASIGVSVYYLRSSNRNGNEIRVEGPDKKGSDVPIDVPPVTNNPPVTLLDTGKKRGKTLSNLNAFVKPEPITNRQARLVAASGMLSVLTPGEIISNEEYADWTNRVAKLKSAIVGVVSNRCDFPILIGTNKIEAFESKLLTYYNGLPDGLECVPSGIGYDKCSFTSILERKNVKSFDETFVSIQYDDFEKRVQFAFENGVGVDSVCETVSKEPVDVTKNEGGTFAKLRPDIKYTITYARKGFENRDGTITMSKDLTEVPFDMVVFDNDNKEWTVSPVTIPLPKNMPEDVELSIDGKRYSQNYVCKNPGPANNTECVYSRRYYNNITNNINIGIAATSANWNIPADNDWVPSPVRIILPDTRDGITCKILTTENVYQNEGDYFCRPKCNIKYVYSCADYRPQTVSRDVVVGEETVSIPMISLGDMQKTDAHAALLAAKEILANDFKHVDFQTATNLIETAKMVESAPLKQTLEDIRDRLNLLNKLNKQKQLDDLAEAEKHKKENDAKKALDDFFAESYPQSKYDAEEIDEILRKVKNFVDDGGKLPEEYLKKMIQLWEHVWGKGIKNRYEGDVEKKDSDLEDKDLPKVISASEAYIKPAVRLQNVIVDILGRHRLGGNERKMFEDAFSEETAWLVAKQKVYERISGGKTHDAKERFRCPNSLPKN